MYMAGRLRTASRPSRTLMLSAVYSIRSSQKEGFIRCGAENPSPGAQPCPFRDRYSKGCRCGGSYPHWHDHAPVGFVPLFLDQAEAQGIAQLQGDRLAVHCHEHIHEVPRVEADGDAFALVRDGK